MSSTLDDLFKQIIQSEQRAQERKSFLNEVKADIDKCHQKLQETDEDEETLRGQIILKTQHLKEVELSLKWLTCREAILKSQIDEHILKVNSLRQNVKETKEKLSTELEQFCATAREFCIGYALLENGWQLREEETRRQLTLISTEKDLLEKELQNYNSQMESIPPIKEENNSIQLTLEDLQSQEKSLIGQYNIEEMKVTEASKERNRVSDIPLHDQEFIKLQKELESVREVHLEKKCQKLQQELQQIQQNLWQKQLKKETNFPQPKLQRPTEKTPSMGNVLKLTNYAPFEPEKIEPLERIHTQILKENDTEPYEEVDFTNSFTKDFPN